MFEFLKSIKGGSADEQQASFEIQRHSCIQCTEDGRVVVVNLDHGKWTLEFGGPRPELITIAPPGGIEVFDGDELLRQIARAFRAITSGSAADRVFRHAFKSSSMLVVLLPAMGETRYHAYEALEEFLKRKYKQSSKDLESIKLYSASNRPGVFRSMRKFKGREHAQVVFNLSPEAVKYFHYYTDAKQDVTIDAMLDEWPEGRAHLCPAIEQGIRSMDPSYFARLRDGLRDGVILLLLPRVELQRNAVLDVAQEVLEQVPGTEPITLDSPRVLRLYRGRG